MRILSDSHVFVWFVTGSRRCPASTRELVGRRDVRAYVSAATAWELATKFCIVKWPEARSIVTNLGHVLTTLRFEALPVTLEHERAAGLFDSPHKDLFDRMLAAQSQIESIPLVAVDPKFDTFGIETIS